MKLGICLVHKNEHKYLDEWLDHHRSLGFSEFYIYDNDSFVSPMKTIEDTRGVTVIPWPGRRKFLLTDAYKHLLEEVKPDLDWIAFIDTDEFIVERYSGALEYVLSHTPSEAIAINWICFGSNYYEQAPDSAFSYKLHADLDDPINQHVKCLLDPRSTNWVHGNPHYFGGYTLNEHMEPVTSPFSSFTADHLYIRHNLTRSKSEFLEKIQRGDANEDDENYSNKWHIDQWDKLEKQLNRCSIL